MKKKNYDDVPSQKTVPQQQRFPMEGAANMTFKTTARPRTELTGDFPMPQFAPDQSGDGTFMTRSHTDGKKKR